MPPLAKFVIGLAATIASAGLFHGPAGYGRRVIDHLDSQVQPLVARQELEGVTASFGRNPLTRDLLFRGPANYFQRGRFVEIMQEEQIKGLRSVGWDPRSPPVEDKAR